LIRGSLFTFLAALTSVFVWLVTFTSAGDEHGRRPQTYTVLVGAEDTSVGASVVGFFPDTVTIHVGDTVHWQRNANEPHTVTFLAGMPLPPFNVPAPDGLPSPLMRNPLTAFPVAPADGRYDGTTFATSGIFGPDPDIFQGVESFDLTFTRAGTYPYVCVVHGVRMSGQVIVVDHPRQVRSPRAVAQEARRLIAEALAAVPAAIAQADAEVPPPTPNPDGTTTYHVLVGFTVGQLDLLFFFPDDLTVSPDDTVEWIFSMEDIAPHTITFLNGADSPDDLIVLPQKEGPPLLLLNPEFLFPQSPGQGEPLTRKGIYSSGRLVQDVPPPSYSLTIGDISGEEPYQCLIHDSSGMLGTLHIVPR
jgi:plastocyanin